MQWKNQNNYLRQLGNIGNGTDLVDRKRFGIRKMVPKIVNEIEARHSNPEEHGCSDCGGVKVQPNDILCGRGNESFSHVGNANFRRYIAESVELYLACRTQCDRAIVIQSVIDKIKETGAKFLRRHQIHGFWIEMNKRRCQDKVGHAIRDAVRKLKIHQSLGTVLPFKYPSRKKGRMCSTTETKQSDTPFQIDLNNGAQLVSLNTLNEKFFSSEIESPTWVNEMNEFSGEFRGIALEHLVFSADESNDHLNSHRITPEARFSGMYEYETHSSDNRRPEKFLEYKSPVVDMNESENIEDLLSSINTALTQFQSYEVDRNQLDHRSHRSTISFDTKYLSDGSFNFFSSTNQRHGAQQHTGGTIEVTASHQDSFLSLINETLGPEMPDEPTPMFLK